MTATRGNCRAAAIIPRAPDSVFVARVITSAMAFRDRLAKLFLFLGLRVRIPPRFLSVFAVATAC